MKFKLILTDSIHFFITNLPQIATLCLPWLAASGLIKLLMVTASSNTESSPLILLAWAFDLAILPIYTAALIQLMAKQAMNQRPDNRELLAAALKAWQPFFFLYLLMIIIGMAVLFVMIIVFTIINNVIGTALASAIMNSGVGFILFVLVGLWVWVRLSFAFFFLVLDGLNPIQAIQKSIDVTRPIARFIFTLVLLCGGPIFAILLFLGNLPPETQFGDAVRVLISIPGSFLLLFIIVLVFRVYMSAVSTLN